MMRPRGEERRVGRGGSELHAERRRASDSSHSGTVSAILPDPHCIPPLLVLLFARLRASEQRDQRRRDTSAVAAQHNHAATSQRTAARHAVHRTALCRLPAVTAPLFAHCGVLHCA